MMRSLSAQTAEIAFDDAPRTIARASSDLQPAEATATLSEPAVPLANPVRDTAQGLDAIRDSRIRCKDGFRDAP